MSSMATMQATFRKPGGAVRQHVFFRLDDDGSVFIEDVEAGRWYRAGSVREVGDRWFYRMRGQEAWANEG